MTKKRMVGVPFLAAVLAWAANAPQDPKTVISSATMALGANNLKTVEFSGAGFDYAIGQAPNPNSPSAQITKNCSELYAAASPRRDFLPLLSPRSRQINGAAASLPLQPAQRSLKVRARAAAIPPAAR